jgi:hypothetical protein
MRAIIIRRAALVCYGVSYARNPAQFRTIQLRKGMGEPSIGILKFDTSEQCNRRAGPGHTNFDIAIEVVAINRCVYFSAGGLGGFGSGRNGSCSGLMRMRSLIRRFRLCYRGRILFCIGISYGCQLFLFA